MLRSFFLTLILLAAALTQCGESKTQEKGRKMTLSISSSAFENGKPIPSKHTCDGKDISPPLAWTGVPKGTKSLALICDDPDAPIGTWVHWVLYNIPPDTTSLPEGVRTTETTSFRAHQGTNDFKRLGYGGPCPPPGKPHRYFFKLYALDTTLELRKGPTKKELLNAMEGHVLAEGDLMGTYKRK